MDVARVLGLATTIIKSTGPTDPRFDDALREYLSHIDEIAKILESGANDELGISAEHLEELVNLHSQVLIKVEAARDAVTDDIKRLRVMSRGIRAYVGAGVPPKNPQLYKKKG